MGQSLLLTYLGWQLPNFPGYATPAHAGLRMLSAFFAIVTHLILVGRKHWRQVIVNETPSDEPILYRTALLGFILCIGFATLWCSVAGASLGIAFLSWLVLFVIAIALTRFVSEGGLLFIQAFRPSDLFIAFVGTRPFTPRHLTVMAFVGKVFTFPLL